MKLISNGNTAEIFQYNGDLICKLFYPGYPMTYVEHEFNNAKAVFQLGIKTPRAHKIVCIGKRNGIIYDRVIGEELASKIYKKNENERNKWIDNFVRFHKELLKYSIDGVMDYKDFLKLFAADSATEIAEINSLEDGNCLLHGDFHPKNIIIDADGRFTLIDMMNVCKGPAVYDIARTYFLLKNYKELQSEYLKLMGYELEAITPYIEVISMIREKEKTGRI